MVISADDVKKLGTILGIWAHPDDESWCMGGLMACAAANGQRVVCVTATYGDAGKTANERKWPQSRLGEIRKNELEKAMDVLGVKEHIWLNYPDGSLSHVPRHEGVSQIASVIQQTNPDTIVSFGPDGMTGHSDHRTVYTWTLEAIRQAGSRATFYRAVESTEKYETIGKKCDELFDIYFNIDEPETISKTKMDLLFELPSSILKQKIESLRVQECQTAGMFADPIGFEYISKSTDHEGFMKVSI